MMQLRNMQECRMTSLYENFTALQQLKFIVFLIWLRISNKAALTRPAVGTRHFVRRYVS